MARAFAEITFTPSVRAAQSRYGSRAANAGFEQAEERRNVLTEREAEFIHARDGFYQASVSETGWPYVQFRGGPKGFLKVLDERTIGYADFRGNVQYISTGNINADGRVSLILMDYPNRRRLKVWARARIVHESEDPGLLARLEVPTYRARVERAVVMTVEAFDWNCPQHITPRFTEEEIAGLVAPLQQQPAQVTAENQTLRAAGPAVQSLGSGPLELVVTGMRQLTSRVRSYELRAVDGGPLPAWKAGAHLTVPVRLPDGREHTRTYSLMGDPADRHVYEIAVLREDSGHGGSGAVHRDYGLGTVIRCGLPRTLFELHDDDSPSVLIAGGIGITPLRAMALALLASDRSFELHYIARTTAEMPLRQDLEARLGRRLKTYFSRDPEPTPLAVRKVLTEAPPDAVFYVCGPSPLIATVNAQASALRITADRIRCEKFVADTTREGDRPVEVRLAQSDKTIMVAPDQTILDALIGAGVDPLYDCRTGTCGTCATKVLDGVPDHRDSALSEAERTRASLMCTCVSRALTDHLTLDF
ncbi:2Fe-2S iron-sulfur cluster-binding protein [Microvirga arabica]|uniref:2Fe-2S iron-sulfur cluster-binding protein n=1 Tax=Microvirga arabica TaxID=1128671 RepID=UPI0019393E15|nr:2Fe-2S iron-sulfur cluster-binding protein [Microvirga arabica]MBM1173442.1 2Fe-2S iron-sulfur cluster binding domain-containing protein [Microvirga arabica]